MTLSLNSPLTAVVLGVTALFVALAVTLAPAHAAKAEIYTGFLSNNAVGGYDPVAYFTEGKPVKGSKDHSFEWKGAVWTFANAENLETFKADPVAYAPQYGGYCAWAMADGNFAKGDPDYWKIVDGKLYLNFNANIQKRWEADIPGFIERADAKWPAVLTE